MPKAYEFLTTIHASDASGEAYSIEVYQEFTVHSDVKLPTFKILRLTDGTPVRLEQDGSYTALGFDEIQLWPEHD